MSDTPRTDAAIYEEDTGLNGMVKVVSPEFARGLEIELAAANAKIKELELEIENQEYEAREEHPE